MTLSETYRAERLIDRRSRGRKARIAGRIIGFGLMGCLIVAIRTDPQLRAMVDDVALAAIGATMPEEAGEGAARGADPQSGNVEDMQRAADATALDSQLRHMPQSVVKIHRGGIARD